ncbi:polysaccharide pyruvyl transferase family protein [Weissella viridescens]|nr:polysaccharide pyruvyl transferase family protein [Weissella viridescens]
MKKYLIRSGLTPLDYKTPSDLIARDFIGTNSGNMLYAYGIFRNLVSPDVTIDSDEYVVSMNRVADINEQYDGYIIALADAIRPDFMPTLKALTKVIRALDIPVYLIGMGVRADYGVAGADLHFEYDDIVRDFVAAILEKSSVVGLRGEITSQYLTNLGFKAGQDHVVIGCPSMYAFGPHLKIRDLPRHVNLQTARFTTNLSKSAPQATMDYLNHLHRDYADASYIPQEYDEFKLLYTGGSTFSIDHYPSHIEDPAYASGQAKFYLNAPTWINDMKSADFSIGTRFHGNVAATLAGTPSITIPIDARMQELVEFHGLPYILPERLAENPTPDVLLQELDVHAPEKKQATNYANFIAFLKANGLEPTIEQDPEMAYADKLEKQAHLYRGVASSEQISDVERRARLAEGTTANLIKEKRLRAAIKHHQEKNRALTNENDKLHAQIEQLQKQLKTATETPDEE